MLYQHNMLYIYILYICCNIYFIYLTIHIHIQYPIRAKEVVSRYRTSKTLQPGRLLVHVARLKGRLVLREVHGAEAAHQAGEVVEHALVPPNEAPKLDPVPFRAPLRAPLKVL